MDKLELEFKLDTLEQLTVNLNELHQTPIDLDHYDKIFRIIHSIKGNSAAGDFTFIAQIAQKVESFIFEMKEDNLNFSFKGKPLLTQFAHSLSEKIKLLKNDPSLQFNFNEITESIILLKRTHMSNRFLIVDDEPEIVDLLTCHLKDFYDGEAVSAINGIEAYQLCQSMEFQFILSDYTMPSMNGGEFIQSLRKNQNINQQTPVIMITAYQPNLINDEKIWNDVFFLEKPIDFQKLNYLLKVCKKIKNEKKVA